jgi:hypothetical protein
MDRASLTKPNAVIDGALEVCRSLREYNAELADENNALRARLAQLEQVKS